VETILKFNPTLVLVADYSRAELVEQIRRAGVRVLSFDRYATLEDAFANLRLLARTIGGAAPARADKIIEDCRRRTAALRKALASTKPIAVIAPSTYGVIPGADTTFPDLCEHANAINLAVTLGHLKGHAAPPNEQMLTWPIEAVVVSGRSTSEALAALRSLPPYQYLAAVREGRAALLAPWMLSCVSHRRVDGYERLARELHPAAFR
jgi:iron complex transport system substrate-binding protein